MDITQLLNYMRKEVSRAMAVPKQYEQPKRSLSEKIWIERCSYAWLKWDTENRKDIK